jgi:peptidoglycan-associated lipoprotein
MNRSLALVASFFVLGPLHTLPGCNHDQPPPSSAASEPATGTSPSEPSAAYESDFVRISPEIVAACKLSSTAQAPKFNTDSAELRPEGRERLGQVGECFRTGPLKGRELSLVGRADPRGSDAHNLTLGVQRAKSVGTFLESQAVPHEAIRISSQGELKAGEDPSLWQKERRVDLDLVPAK